MAETRCFLLTDTGRFRVFLRRYATSDMATKCPTGRLGYHNAAVLLGTFDNGQQLRQHGGRIDAGSHLWPQTCDACGYVFVQTDERMVNSWPEQRRSDTGDLTTIQEAPVGAMWWADWLTGHHASPKHKGRGDGPHLVVKTPGGDWDIDAPSSNGDGWDRSGNPPDIVARPSILMDTYHGFLGGSGGDRPGYLVDC